MKRVIYVVNDYDTVVREEFSVSFPALLVDDYTLIKKLDNYLDICQSTTPIKVESDGAVIDHSGMYCVEIAITDEGMALELEEIATMTVAELTKYLKIGRSY